MSQVTFACQSLLAVTFTWSGLAKLSSTKATRAAAESLGVPRALAATFGRTLPVVELILAASLAIPASAKVATTASLILLTIFTILLAIARLRGKSVKCNCFGSFTHAGKLNNLSIARNMALILAAAAALLIGGPYDNPLIGWVNSLEEKSIVIVLVAVCTILTVVVILEAATLLQLMRQQGRLLLRLDELEKSRTSVPRGPEIGIQASPFGSDAPRFALRNTRGELISLDDLLARGRPVFLIFISANCAPCSILLNKFPEWEESIAATYAVVFVISGQVTSAHPELWPGQHALILPNQQKDLLVRYGVRGTPSALTIAPDGTISSSLACGLEEIVQLAKTVAPSSAL